MPESTDIYQRAKAIAGELASNDLLPESDRLVTAIRSGSTGTEIFMNLRWELEQVSAKTLSAGLEAKVTTLIRDLDEVLA